MALLLQWIFKIPSIPLLRDGLVAILKVNIGEDLWQLNLKDVDTKYFVKDNCQNSWWMDLLQEWCHFNYHSPDALHSVNKQIIWCNTHVRIKNVPVFNATVYAAGIRTFSDISTNRVMLTYEQLSSRWPNVLTWLEFASLKSTIPRRWARTVELQVRESKEAKYMFDYIAQFEKVSPIAYILNVSVLVA